MYSKSLVLLGGLMVFAACSSTQKKQEATTPATVVQTTKEVTIPVVAQPTANAKKEDSKKDEIVCERGSEKRTLHIEAVEPKGCKLWYSQFSTKDPVASSHIANTHCEKVQATIRGRLEEAKFTCSSGVTAAPAVTAPVAAKETPTATPSATPAKK
jgi:hypothetical protein